MKVAFCIPTVTRPYQACLDSLEASVPLLDAAGIEHVLIQEVGNPYISGARAKMLRKALDARVDAVVFIDHDLSWRPGDLVKLIQTPGDVVAGTYRFKGEGPVSYMGTIEHWPNGSPMCSQYGCIKASLVPAGFLKLTVQCIDRFMEAYPELCYGERFSPSVDLFNHGAHKGVWWGEDYAFCRRWREAGGEIWLQPDLQLDHHGTDAVYPGNFHEYLMAQPGANPEAYADFLSAKDG